MNNRGFVPSSQDTIQNVTAEVSNSHRMLHNLLITARSILPSSVESTPLSGAQLESLIVSIEKRLNSKFVMPDLDDALLHSIIVLLPVTIQAIINFTPGNVPNPSTPWMGINLWALYSAGLGLSSAMFSQHKLLGTRQISLVQKLTEDNLETLMHTEIVGAGFIQHTLDLRGHHKLPHLYILIAFLKDYLRTPKSIKVVQSQAAITHVNPDYSLIIRADAGTLAEKELFHFIGKVLGQIHPTIIDGEASIILDRRSVEKLLTFQLVDVDLLHPDNPLLEILDMVGSDPDEVWKTILKDLDYCIAILNKVMESNSYDDLEAIKNNIDTKQGLFLGALRLVLNEIPSVSAREQLAKLTSGLSTNTVGGLSPAQIRQRGYDIDTDKTSYTHAEWMEQTLVAKARAVAAELIETTLKKLQSESNNLSHESTGVQMLAWLEILISASTIDEHNLLSSGLPHTTAVANRMEINRSAIAKKYLRIAVLDIVFVIGMYMLLLYTSLQDQSKAETINPAPSTIPFGQGSSSTTESIEHQNLPAVEIMSNVVDMPTYHIRNLYAGIDYVDDNLNDNAVFELIPFENPATQIDMTLPDFVQPGADEAYVRYIEYVNIPAGDTSFDLLSSMEMPLVQFVRLDLPFGDSADLPAGFTWELWQNSAGGGTIVFHLPESVPEGLTVKLTYFDVPATIPADAMPTTPFHIEDDRDLAGQLNAINSILESSTQGNVTTIEQYLLLSQSYTYSVDPLVINNIMGQSSPLSYLIALTNGRAAQCSAANLGFAIASAALEDEDGEFMHLLYAEGFINTNADHVLTNLERHGFTADLSTQTINDATPSGAISSDPATTNYINALFSRVPDVMPRAQNVDTQINIIRAVDRANNQASMQYILSALAAAIAILSILVIGAKGSTREQIQKAQKSLVTRYQQALLDKNNSRYASKKSKRVSSEEVEFEYAIETGDKELIMFWLILNSIYRNPAYQTPEAKWFIELLENDNPRWELAFPAGVDLPPLPALKKRNLTINSFYFNFKSDKPIPNVPLMREFITKMCAEFDFDNLPTSTQELINVARESSEAFNKIYTAFVSREKNSNMEKEAITD